MAMRYEEEIRRLERSSRWATLGSIAGIIIVIATLAFATSRLLKLQEEATRLIGMATEAYNKLAKTHVEQGNNAAASKAYIDAARIYREQGNYKGAFSELGKARAVDPGNSEVLREIGIAKRACAAENMLGGSNRCE